MTWSVESNVQERRFERRVQRFQQDGASALVAVPRHDNGCGSRRLTPSPNRFGYAAPCKGRSSRVVQAGRLEFCCIPFVSIPIYSTKSASWASALQSQLRQPFSHSIQG